VRTMLSVTGVADLLDTAAAPTRVIPFRCRASRPIVNAVTPRGTAAV